MPGWKVRQRQALNARKSQLIVKMTAHLQSTNSVPRHRLEVKQLAWRWGKGEPRGQHHGQQLRQAWVGQGTVDDG